MKTFILILTLLPATIAMGSINYKTVNISELEFYQTSTAFINREIRPRIMVLDYYNDSCFYVVRFRKSRDRVERNCKFLLKDFPESIRDENIPKSNIVDFENSDLNSETEVNVIKHINIKENGDIVFTYKRGVGAKSALYFCTQKLNHEDEGLAENPIPECEFIERGDFDGEFRKIYDMYRDEFYPAR